MPKLLPLKGAIVLRKGKQTDILDVIVKGNPDGTFADLDQIMERVPYTTTKPAFQFSLRCLIRKQLIERAELRYRDGAKRRVIKPTLLGYQLLKASKEA